MIKREGKFAIRFRHWVRANPLGYSCTFETKDTRGRKSLPFSDLKQNQQDFSVAIEEGEKGVLMRNQGGNGEPDYTYHYKQPAFVVIHYTGRGFVVIRAIAFSDEGIKSNKKSLTWERAKELATYVDEF